MYSPTAMSQQSQCTDLLMAISAVTDASIFSSLQVTMDADSCRPSSTSGSSSGSADGGTLGLSVQSSSVAAATRNAASISTGSNAELELFRGHMQKQGGNGGVLRRKLHRCIILQRTGAYAVALIWQKSDDDDGEDLGRLPVGPNWIATEVDTKKHLIEVQTEERRLRLFANDAAQCSAFIKAFREAIRIVQGLDASRSKILNDDLPHHLVETVLDPKAPAECRRMIACFATQLGITEKLVGAVQATSQNEAVLFLRDALACFAARDDSGKYQQLLEQIGSSEEPPADPLAPLKFNVDDVAEQLVNEDRDNFSNISVEEWLDCSWQAADPARGANIKKMIKCTNERTLWVANAIVFSKDKIATWTWFVHLATALLKRGDYEAAFAIVAGLEEQAVYRLKIADKAPECVTAQLKHMTSMLISTHDRLYSLYRSELKARLQEMACVPLLSFVLRNLYCLREGHKAKKSAPIALFQSIWPEISEMLSLQDRIERLPVKGVMKTALRDLLPNRELYKVSCEILPRDTHSATISPACAAIAAPIATTNAVVQIQVNGV